MSEKDSLEKIGDKLDTTFEIQEAESLQKDLIKLQEKKSEIVQKESQGVIVLDDQIDLREGIKDVILHTKAVMEKLEKDIKIGSKAYSHEVYSKLVSSIAECFKQLTDINKLIFEAKVKLNKLDVEDIKEGKVLLSASQLNAIIDKARENNSMKNIDASFKIEE